MEKKEVKPRPNLKIPRRTFLKASGAVGAVFGISGLGLYGYQAGKDPATYTGCEGFQGAAQTFNRKRFSINKPPYEKVAPTSRPDARTEVIFNRMSVMRNAAVGEMTIEELEEPYKSYYLQHPEDFELDKQNSELKEKVKQDSKENRDKYILAKAWADAMSAVKPKPIGNAPPEISDFPNSDPDRQSQPMKLKNPKLTSALIKKVSYEFGSVLVGITKLNPDWVYKYPGNKRGFKMDEPIEIPKHWEYAVVVGTPMSWDPMYANPNYGTSYDAYSKSRIVAFRLASFIKQLGYAARPHTPGTDYDLMVPPIMVDSGLGQQGRHSIVITPELGCNFRPAVVTTNIPLAVDKPISFGVDKFCKTCKICADRCPGGAITKGEKQIVRGYRRYQLHSSKCLNFWNSAHGSMGCRLCIASCPYTRKSNWVHRAALHLTANDPTGISHRLLTGMQKRFYPAPKPDDYYAETLGGKNASYRKAPWWLKTDDFIDL
ncbi:MAG: reductive dehalogenase [Planctomycetota bacterium]|jgi:reductive dehalogenase